MNNFYIPSKVEEGKDMNDVFQRKLTVNCYCVMCNLYSIFVPHQGTIITCPTVCPVYFVDLEPRRAGASPDKRTRWKSQVIGETQTVYVLTLCYILRAVMCRRLRWTSQNENILSWCTLMRGLLFNIRQNGRSKLMWFVAEFILKYDRFRIQ